MLPPGSPFICLFITVPFLPSRVKRHSVQAPALLKKKNKKNPGIHSFPLRAFSVPGSRGGLPSPGDTVGGPYGSIPNCVPALSLVTRPWANLLPGNINHSVLCECGGRCHCRVQGCEMQVSVPGSNILEG